MDVRATAQKHCDELSIELSRVLESRRLHQRLFEMTNAQEAESRRDLLNQIGSFFAWLQSVTVDHVVLVLARMNDRTPNTVSLNSLATWMKKIWNAQQLAEFTQRQNDFSNAVKDLEKYRNEYIGHRKAVAVIENGGVSVPWLQIDGCIERASKCIESARAILRPDTIRIDEPLWLGDGTTLVEVIRNSQTLGYLQLLAWDECKRDLIMQRLRDRAEIERTDFESLLQRGT